MPMLTESRRYGGSGARHFSDLGPRPEQHQTLGTSVIGSMDRRYYFQDTLSLGIFWVDLARLSLADSAAAELSRRKIRIC